MSFFEGWKLMIWGGHQESAFPKFFLLQAFALLSSSRSAPADLHPSGARGAAKGGQCLGFGSVGIGENTPTDQHILLIYYKKQQQPQPKEQKVMLANQIRFE